MHLAAGICSWATAHGCKRVFSSTVVVEMLRFSKRLGASSELAYALGGVGRPLL